MNCIPFIDEVAFRNNCEKAVEAIKEHSDNLRTNYASFDRIILDKSERQLCDGSTCQMSVELDVLPYDKYDSVYSYYIIFSYWFENPYYDDKPYFFDERYEICCEEDGEIASDFFDESKFDILTFVLNLRDAYFKTATFWNNKNKKK